MRRLPLRTTAATAAVLLITLNGATGHATIASLQNDSWTSGSPYNCPSGAAGWDYGETKAAGYAAGAGDYPLQITAVQILACGSPGAADLVALDIYADSLDSTADPGQVLWSSDLTSYGIVPGLNEIDVSGEDIAVESGGVRVALTAVNNDPPTVDVATDTGGIQPQRNFTRNNLGTWGFADDAGFTNDFVIRAIYAAPSTLSVNKDGNGSGTVTSSPAGIDCGSDCSEDYPHGSQATLSATASIGSVFDGWSEPSCPGKDPCVVTLDADVSVTATFSTACQNRAVTQDDATAGDDVLTGTPQADVIAALDGDDQVTAYGGGDRVCGGSGDDTELGGGGRDRLLGDADADALKGGGGDDTLNGGAGRDALTGGPGIDVCIGGPGIDTASQCEETKSIEG